uniref:fibronectin type III domain-containing protein n=1 Tax=Treponema endosymbiont of Eucomonympha sp. TaxID=1580831 RepID=UPI000ADF5EED
MNAAYRTGFIIALLSAAACTLPLAGAGAKRGALPPAPTGVTAEAAQVGSVLVSWGAVPEAASYSVWRAESDERGAPGAFARIGTLTDTSFTDRNVAQDRDYWYKASAARHDAGESPLSAAAFATTKRLPPPAGLKAAVLSATQIAVSWDEVSGAEGYRLYRSAFAESAYTLLAEVSGTVYVDSGVAAGNGYYYKASSVDFGREGAQSAYAYAAVRLPDAPANIRAETKSATSIALSWQAAEGAASYKIYRSTGTAENFNLLDTPDITATAYVDSGLNPDTDYYYKIASQNGIGTGAQSEAAAASTKAPSAAPTGLSADGTQYAQSVYVSWEAVARAAHYCLYRAEGAGGEYALAASVSGLSHTDGGLARGTDYYYQVSAANGAGEGPRAEPVIAAIPQLAAPSGLSAAAASKTSIRVSWNAVAGATGYTLYRAASGSGAYSALATVAGTSYTHTGLSAGAEQYYKASATDGSGEGALSEAVSAIIAPPAAPAGLAIEPLSESSLKISWNAVPGAALYTLWRGGTQVVTQTASPYTDTNLRAGTSYSYQVSATNELGTGTKSAAVSVYTLPTPLSEEVWYDHKQDDGYFYDYYSFPVHGGTYRIQWANTAHTG